jgi:hypothetical protein
MKLLHHTCILLSLVTVMIIIPLAKTSGTKAASPPITVSEKPFVITATPLKEAAPAAYYSEGDSSWSFSAEVLEIKDVSIYGRPGSIAKIGFVDRGELNQAWVVLRMEDYSFIDGSTAITLGDRITLKISGEYVSSKGVDWSVCPMTDAFCQNASFIEGGFPVSEDFDGLTISPSNTLIHWGSVASDWINGMLAWKIRLSEG